MKSETTKNLNSIIEDVELLEQKVGRNSSMLKLAILKLKKSSKLSEEQVVEAWDYLELNLGAIGYWANTRVKSDIKNLVASKVRKAITTLEETKHNILEVEDGTRYIVDVIFKKYLTPAQQKAKESMLK